MNTTQVGRLVWQGRRDAGLSQAALAARIGTTQAAISKIETGRTMPTIALLTRMAHALERPITLTLGSESPGLSRAERRARVRKVLGDQVFNPWDRNPTAAEADSLRADGLTRERFER